MVMSSANLALGKFEWLTAQKKSDAKDYRGMDGVWKCDAA